MREELERSFFPFVTKPGRYAGGEPGRIVKSPQGRLLYLHAFPDLYEYGQQNSLVSSLYHIINTREDFLCEQVFIPDRDACQLLLEKNLPLFSLESSRPAVQFDLMGFSLLRPELYVNVLSMMELAGLPLFASERCGKHPLLVGLDKGALTPEPLAPFFDIFLPGDAEESLPELLETLNNLKGKDRREILEHLARTMPSVYIPSLYDDNRQPLHDFVPATISARVLNELKTDNYQRAVIVPLIETVQTNVEIETSQSRDWSGIEQSKDAENSPVLVRPHDAILEQAISQIAVTGYSAVNLRGDSGVKEFASLASALSQRLLPERVALLIEELVPGSVTPLLLDAICRVRRPRVLIPVHAASPRLRLLLGFDFPDEAIFDSVRLIFSKGWKALNVRFLVGLPTESDDDLRAIATMVNAICRIGQEQGGHKNIIIELRPFQPTPHSRFQWDAAESETELARRIALVRRSVRGSNIQIKHPDFAMSNISCAIIRGGRELAPLLRTALEISHAADGETTTDWSVLWKAAFEKHSINHLDYLGAKPFSENLPWSHISTGISTEQMAEQRQQASKKTTEFIPQFKTISAKSSAPTLGFGRSKKKLPSRSFAPPTKNRVRIQWGKSARLRYMSHLNNLRLLERSIRRARLPVAWSQGQNPTMKLSLGPPLPLGFTSEAELLDIVLETSFASDMIDRLKRVLPEGIQIYDATVLLGSGPSLTADLNRVVYTLPLSLWTDIVSMESAIAELLDRESILWQREGKKGLKEIDLRPGIYNLSILDDRLSMTLGVGDGGFVRPTELVSFLTDSLTLDIRALPFHRAKLFRETPVGSVVDQMAT